MVIWIIGAVLWIVGTTLFAVMLGRWLRWIREQDEVAR